MAKMYKPGCWRELLKLTEDESVCLGDIDTSLITSMDGLFRFSKRKDFSGIETWDTSNVTTMAYMFLQAEHFNHPIGNWDVSNVTNMEYMFAGCTGFNQPLNPCREL